jgi:hypothetical protein
MEDKDLFEQLGRGPLARNGFDDALRQKIHERINNPKRRTLRSQSLRWGRLSAAFALFAVILIGAWTWTNQSLGGKNGRQQALSEASASNDLSAAAMMENRDVEAAMLIGIRKDDGPRSTYRTVLVVPNKQVLEVAASGSGIYMPYGQKFWKIDAVDDSLGKGMQTLEASPADSLTEAVPSKMAVASPRRSTEKLLYVGNKYVSVLQTTTVTDKGQSVNESNLWVNEAKQLLPSVRESNSNALSDGHRSFADALGSDVAGEVGDIQQWAINRVPGKWVANQPSAALTVGNGASDADLQLIDKPLTKNVIAYDTLALSWDDIYAVDPAAKDAFTSPTEDVLAVVVDDGIEMYPYRSKDGFSKPLKLAMSPGESVIMVQWALEPKYIASWKKLLGGWIPPANDQGL